MNARQLAVLSGCLFLIGSAEVVAGPMMGLMGAHFGVPSSAIAYLPAAYGLTYAVAALLAGPWSDRLGRRRLLQLGLLGFAVCSALVPHAFSFWMAVFLSALTGVCAAVIQPNALALVADLSEPERVGSRIGHVFIGLMSAFVVTPALAGSLAMTLGWAWPYRALAGLALLAWVAVTHLFSPAQAAQPAGTRAVSSMLTVHRAALTVPGLRWRLLASYLWLGWAAGFGAVVAEVAAGKLRITGAQAGGLAGLFGGMVMVGNLSSGWLHRLWGDAALRIAALVAGVGMLAWALPWTSTLPLAVFGCLWAWGYGGGGPLHHARLSALSEAYRGTINSYHASLLNLGIFSVSALMGALVHRWGLSVFCAVAGGVVLSGAMLFWTQNPGPQAHR